MTLWYDDYVIENLWGWMFEMLVQDGQSSRSAAGAESSNRRAPTQTQRALPAAVRSALIVGVRFITYSMSFVMALQAWCLTASVCLLCAGSGSCGGLVQCSETGAAETLDTGTGQAERRGQTTPTTRQRDQQPGELLSPYDHVKLNSNMSTTTAKKIIMQRPLVLLGAHLLLQVILLGRVSLCNLYTKFVHM